MKKGEMICPKCGKNMGIRYEKRNDKWILSFKKGEWADAIYKKEKKK